MVRLHLALPSPPPPTTTVEGERLHHLVHVLRLGPGSALEVFDGQGHAYRARIASVREGSAVLELGERTTVERVRPVAIVQAMPKGDRFEWVLQKGTELGASRFVPVESKRTVVKLDGRRAVARQQRWQKIAEEASRQCGRSHVPPVDAPQPLVDAAKALAQDHLLIVLDEEERHTRLSQVVAATTSGQSIALIIGPEGGLDREEVAALDALGGQRASLGERILRTETAPLAALTVVRHLDGELG